MFGLSAILTRAILIGVLLVALFAYWMTMRHQIASLRAEVAETKAALTVCDASLDSAMEANATSTAMITRLQEQLDALTTAAPHVERRVEEILRREWTPPAEHGHEAMNKWLESFP